MSYQSFIAKESTNEFNECKQKATPVAMVAPEVKHNVDADTEITVTCAVMGCEDSKHLEKHSLYRFPEESNLRQIWTDLTGRNNWTPTDYSYICIQHFSVDCFKCDAAGNMVLVENAVPSLKLPRHVLEVEYIDEDTLENDTDASNETHEYSFEEEDEMDSHMAMNGTTLTENDEPLTKPNKSDNVELLKLFTVVQRMQKEAVSLKEKLKNSMRIHNRQSKHLQRIEEKTERKKKILEEKKKKKTKILLTLQDKINEDMNGLVLAMPVRQTEDLKNFALSIYKYSPQAYIYIRNTLRTMLPSTEVLESWLTAGFQPKNMLSNANLIKVTSEQTESDLTCKVSIG